MPSEAALRRGAFLCQEPDGDGLLSALGAALRVLPPDARIGVVHVQPVGNSILSAVERSLRTSQRRADEQGVPFDADSLISPITATVTPLVSLLLYLCSEAAEIGDGTRAPAYPSPVITRKHGPRLFPPDRATTWDVGVRLGAALRQARQAESNGSGPGAGTVRPHVRRAHWHTYRVGAGRQGRALRWINPILVGTTSADGLVPVVRDVT